MLNQQTDYQLVKAKLCSSANNIIIISLLFALMCILVPVTSESLSSSSTPAIFRPKSSPVSSSHDRPKTKVTRDLCPLMDTNVSGCSCYQFTDGLYVECPSTSLDSVERTLHLLQSPIKSLTVYNLDPSVTRLPGHLFINTTIESIHISFTSLTNLSDSLFSSLSGCLKSLAIVNSDLPVVPQSVLSGLKELTSLDLEANRITEIESYTFYGLPLVTLNLQGNRLSSLLEYSFGGLENTLDRLILTNNQLDGFPITALRRLRKLRELKISGNKITDIPDDGFTRLTALQSLDLSSNSIVTLNDKSFITMPKLITLSLYHNRLSVLEDRTFHTLLDLETLDLSHNTLTTLSGDLFFGLSQLRTVDLSHNHLHYIEFGTFHNLPSLREVFLNQNNLLKLNNESFINSTSISVLFLAHNAITEIEFGTFAELAHLSQLHLSFNSLRAIHPNLFKYNHELRSLSLDNNLIANIQPGTFQELVELRDLRLQRNLLKKVRKGVFYSFPNLQELHLQNNRIEVIENEALASLANLELLNIQGNKLIEMSDALSKYPSSLKYLQLNNNTIFAVHNDSLLGQGNLEILWLNWNKVQKLTRQVFAHCIGLQKLYLSNNEISSIEPGTFDNLSQLVYLSLENNNLNHLSSEVFKGTPSLSELYLSGNHLMDIEPGSFVSMATSLRILTLSSNQLYVIRQHFFANLSINELALSNAMVEEIDPRSFEGLTSLATLDLSDNNLSADRIAALSLPSSLRNFNVSGNNLTTLKSSSGQGQLNQQATSLEVLDLSNSGINVTFNRELIASLSSINSLHLKANGLSGDLSELETIEPLSTLRELYLDWNRLETVPKLETISKFPSIEVLSLSGNVIRHLGAGSFRYNRRIRSLNLSNNSLSVLDPGSLGNLTLLRDLDLSHNVMRYISTGVFSNLPSLTLIDLTSNWFQYIPNNFLRTALPTLKILKLNFNPILRIREDLSILGSFPGLDMLTIESGNLSIIASHDFFGFDNLTSLSLRRNHISKISPGSFRPLTRLRTIDLSENELEILPEERLSGLTNLETLNLSRNHLLEMPYFGPSSSQLRILDLSGNRLTRVDTFGHLGDSLTTLYLNNNIISWIANNAFQNLSSLEILDLRQNFITHLSVTPLESIEVTIDQLFLAGNPVHCDCRLSSLWEWLQDHSRLLGSVERDKDLTCAGPDKLFGSMILSLHPIDFCPMPTISLLEVFHLEAKSLTLHWEVQNETLVSGFTLDYHLTSDRVPSSLTKTIGPLQRYFSLDNLESETWYSFCLHANEKYLKTNGKPRAYVVGQQRNYAEYATSNRKCLQVQTLSPNEKTKLSLSTIGIIVGATVCVVFVIIIVILLATLSYCKKRRRPAKTEVPEEYITYRHFSLPTSENVYS